MITNRLSQPALAELERFFTAFADKFRKTIFKGESVSSSMIAIQPKEQHKAIAWFAPHRWEKKGLTLKTWNLRR